MITDRGRASHVLITIADYERLTRTKETIVDMLAMPDADKVEFDPSPLRGPLARPADLG